jgi:threonine dehydratase
MTATLADIEDARRLLEGIIIPTPILSDEKLSTEIGAHAFLKAECLQRSGSFKVRGAYNKISRLSDDEKSRGVIAASAGNHAQGVALAARLHNIKATIVLPEFAPLTKVQATKAQGAEVILRGASFDEAVQYSRELEKERGLTYVHAFDDDLVIAGQGTIGWEIAEDLPQATVVVVPIGGGGIISGIALAVKNLLPTARVIGVQAANVAAVNKSLEIGAPVELISSQPTIADGIAVKRPGDKTLRMIEEYVDEVVEVTEEEIARGIYHCVQNTHLVVEGAGAAGVAALLAKKIKLHATDNVCAVLAGGNIDANLLALVLQQVLVRQGRYIILKLLVLDRPGALADLLNHTASTGANVIEVFHRRAMWLAPLGRVGIELLLEVRDETHGRDVLHELKSAGYHVEREGQGDWEE